MSLYNALSPIHTFLKIQKLSNYVCVHWKINLPDLSKSADLLDNYKLLRNKETE